MLNLGVRYEQLPMADPQNRLLTFIAGRKSSEVSAAPVGLLFPGDEGIRAASCGRTATTLPQASV
jgi:hypothetical protein